MRGETRPKELAHAELMTEWVIRLHADPSEALLLAVRASHLRRWVVPRSSYPDGRAGYLRWRRDQERRHAEEAGAILRAAGYDGTTVDRVADIVNKRGLGKGDDEVQAFEDALCLVFLETQFRDLADRLDPDRMVEVVAKTLAKMSDLAKRTALAMDLTDADRTLLERALAS